VATLKKETIHFRVSEKMRADSEKCAESVGMNLGEYVRYAVMIQNKKILKNIEK